MGSFNGKFPFARHFVRHREKPFRSRENINIQDAELTVSNPSIFKGRVPKSIENLKFVNKLKLQISNTQNVTKQIIVIYQKLSPFFVREF